MGIDVTGQPGPALSEPKRQLSNFTVLGEAADQVSGEVKARFPDIAWQQPQRLRNRIVHGC